MNDRVIIPNPPAEWARGIDYRNELDLARFSRVSYLDEDSVGNPDPEVNPDYRHLFNEELRRDRWVHDLHLNSNDSSGFVAHTFINDSQKRVVIAIRGSDNFADWIGPDVALARDGELLDMLKLPSPGTDRTREQMVALQETLLPGDAWDPQSSCPPALADAPLAQQQAVRSLFNKPGDGPFARFLDASLAGDTDAARKAARDLCATPEATAWLQSGRERLSAPREPAPASGHANEAEGQALRQHAAIPPEGRG